MDFLIPYHESSESTNYGCVRAWKDSPLIPLQGPGTGGHGGGIPQRFSL